MILKGRHEITCLDDKYEANDDDDDDAEVRFELECFLTGRKSV